MTWHFEINRRVKSRVSDWRQNRFLPRAFPRLRLQRFGPNPAVGRNRRRENRFGKKRGVSRGHVTARLARRTHRSARGRRPESSSDVRGHSTRTSEAYTCVSHPPRRAPGVKPPFAIDVARRAISPRKISDATPGRRTRRGARRRPRRRNSRVFSSTVLSMPRSRRSRALAVSSSALIEGPFPPPHVSNFSIGRSGDSGCSVAHADTPLPSLVVPAA